MTDDTKAIEGEAAAAAADASDELGLSPLARLRQKREALAQQDGTLLLPVPGYDDELWVRYKYIPFKVAKESGERLLGSVAKELRELYGCADTLLLCCLEVLLRSGDGSLKPVHEDGQVTRFDDRLGEALGFTAADARGAVLSTFNNDYAVIDTAMRVSAWLKDTTKRVDGGLLGE